MASYILDKSHEVVTRVVRQGDTVVDATVGNGWDTVFLARLVGSTGRVLGFDIQLSAISATEIRLSQAGLEDRCRIVECTHASMAEILTDEGMAQPSAVMFNLGYLPGGVKSVVTTPETTVKALDAALEILADCGVITIVVYQEHPGADLECQSILDWSRNLDPSKYSFERIEDPEGPSHAPFLIVVRSEL